MSPTPPDAHDGAMEVDEPPNSHPVSDNAEQGQMSPKAADLSGIANESASIDASFQEGPSILERFDWEDFEARYEQALLEANEQEQSILKEAESLSEVRVFYLCYCFYQFLLTSQYFAVWASAASKHDDERAVKRLQTRQRFVNLSEEKLEHKQQHCELRSIEFSCHIFLSGFNNF